MFFKVLFVKIKQIHSVMKVKACRQRQIRPLITFLNSGRGKVDGLLVFFENLKIHTQIKIHHRRQSKRGIEEFGQGMFAAI